jgi:hypothetical protein
MKTKAAGIFFTTTALTMVVGTMILLAIATDTEAQIEYKNGRWELANRVSWVAYLDSFGMHRLRHLPEGEEGYGGYDWNYSHFPMWMGELSTKIVSIIPGHELLSDLRPIDSLTPVNLELSLHTRSGNPITLPNLGNWLQCIIDPANSGWTFEPKPITLWRRNIIDPNSNPNDPNNYTISFMADIREAIAKQGGIIPLPDLNGTYQSQVAYAWLQVRFDIFAGDFDFNRRLDFADLSYLAQDWMATDVNSVADITSPNGLPDKAVDMWDLELFSRNWLKDSNALLPPMPGEASNPVPADGATSVGADTDLTWTAGSYATSHDVYFGTNNPPSFQIQYAQVTTTFDPGTLSPDTTYYWRIDELNASGKTTGVVWSFTTSP